MKIIKILGAAFENGFGGVVSLSNHGHLLKDTLWRIFLVLERGKTTFACNSHENIVPKYQGVDGWFLGKIGVFCQIDRLCPPKVVILFDKFYQTIDMNWSGFSDRKNQFLS